MGQHYLDVAERDLILAIAERPAHHLRAASLSRFNAYLDGYAGARSEFVLSKQCLQMREPFHRWLCRSVLQLDYGDLDRYRSLPASAIVAISNLNVYPISSALSLVCEDDVSAFQRYLSAWKDWLKQSQLGEQLVTVDQKALPPPHMRGMIPILKSMSNSPSLHWGTLPALRCFLDGYIFAYNEIGKSPHRPFPFSNFTIWIREKIVDIPLDTDYTWDRLVLFNSRNASSAVDVFFRLVRSYCSETGIDFS